ncbi:MAG: general secretion pathway protein GspK [Magnetospirillum sp.]|nr:general secretion pathway protein GspK [Magnetospirillum sp.]
MTEGGEAAPRGAPAGFALVAVLAIAAVLSLAVLAVGEIARRRLATSALLEDELLARALADAGAMRAVWELLAADGGLDRAEAWSADLRPRRLTRESGTVAVAIRDEGSVVDLNDGGEEVLAGLFRAAGAANPAALAAAVADWRDEDGLVRLNGAEADAYAKAGRPWRPRDGVFETVDELRLVLGMTDTVFARVAALLTVYGHRGDLDLDTAPPALLQTQPGIDAARAAAMVAARPRRPAVSAARAFAIRAEARTVAGTVFVREAVVHLTREPTAPTRLYLWRQGAAEESSPAAGEGVRPDIRPGSPP